MKKLTLIILGLFISSIAVACSSIEDCCRDARGFSKEAASCANAYATKELAEAIKGQMFR